MDAFELAASTPQAPDQPLAWQSPMISVDAQGNSGLDGTATSSTDTVDTPAQPPPSQATDILNTPQSDPALEEMRLKMIRTHTQTQQQLHEERRQAQEIQRQALAIIQAQQAQAAQAARPQPPERKGLIASLGDHARTMTPDALNALSALDGYLQEQLDDLRKQNPNDTVQQLQQKLSAIESAITAQTRAQEVDGLYQRYGRETVDAYAQPVVALMNANPGLTVHQAFFAAAPQVVEQAAFKRAQQELSTRVKQAQSANLAGGTASPSAAPNQGYSPGESMRDSFKAVGGAV